MLIAGAALGATVRPSAASVASMIVVDAYTGRVIQSYNADALRAPASLTKMMTLYLTFEALEHGKLRWNQYLTVSRHAATRMPSKVYLRPGQRVRVRDLVYATAVHSANDAAVVLAEGIAGSEFRFAKLMNRRARQIGMTHTVFRTATGLPARGQHSTARDLAKLARALILYHPKYYHIFSTRYYRFGRRFLRNTNHLLGRMGIDGIKTGYTHRAGFNLVTSARRGKRRIVTVVLGGSSSRARFRKSSWLVASSWRRRPSTRQVASIRRPPAETAGRATRTTRHTVIAQVAAAPRFRPSIKTDSTAPHTVHPKSIVVADSTARRKIDLSIMGSRAAAAERKPERTTRSSPKTAAKPPPPKARKTTIVARRVPAPTSKPIVTRTAYAIQVGANARYALAQRSARRAYDALPHKLRHGVRVAVMDPKDFRGRLYRARIIGLTKGAAKAACRILKQKSLRCLAIRTGRRFHVASATIPAHRKPIRTARTTVERGYAVQVGAVARYASARQLASKARRSLPRILSRRTQAQILRPGSYHGRLYRVRLSGLSQDEAHKACRILKRKSVRCMTLRAWIGRTRHPRTAARRGHYAVQVGAVPARSRARRLIRKAQRTLPRRLAKRVEPRVLAPSSYDGRLYRARLNGLSRMEATRACKILRRESLDCLPYRIGA